MLRLVVMAMEINRKGLTYASAEPNSLINPAFMPAANRTGALNTNMCC